MPWIDGTRGNVRKRSKCKGQICFVMKIRGRVHLWREVHAHRLQLLRVWPRHSKADALHDLHDASRHFRFSSFQSCRHGLGRNASWCRKAGVRSSVLLQIAVRRRNGCMECDARADTQYRSVSLRCSSRRSPCHCSLVQRRWQLLRTEGTCFVAFWTSLNVRTLSLAVCSASGLLSTSSHSLQFVSEEIDVSAL